MSRWTWSLFSGSIPAAYAGLQVTQLSALAPVRLDEVQSRLVTSLAQQLGYSEINDR